MNLRDVRAATAAASAVVEEALGRHNVRLPSVPAATEAMLDAMLAQGVRLRLQGVHSAGLSNNHLAQYLAARGKDFLADTPQMRAYMKRTALREWAGADHPPTQRQAKESLREAAVEWVEGRFNGRRHDVTITSNSLRYARWKRKKVGNKPVGVLTGTLRDSVTEATLSFGGGLT